MPIDRDQWRRAEALFHAALAMPAAERAAFLDDQCLGEADLREQVGLLLASDERAGLFLETPALASPGVAGPTRGALVGQRFGPYQLLAFIGAGGMGEVYRAHDDTLGRDVAVKILPPEFARDDARLARFRREARTLASLDHPHIAAIHGIEESGDLVFLVLELVEGGTLRGPVDVKDAIRYAWQVASALEAAHEHGIVHRDLKPANLRLTPDGRVKVLDFGVAKVRTRGNEPRPSQDEGVTGTVCGSIIGTPGYMSPEQARGEVVDERADVWAFGCLCWEFLTGARAFPGETDVDAMTAVLERQPDWRVLPASTPRRLRVLIRRCLEKDPSLRPARMAEVRQALDHELRPGEWRRAAAWVVRPRHAVPVAVVLALTAAVALRDAGEDAELRRIREKVVPEILRLQDAGEYAAASRLTRRAELVAPDEPSLHLASLRTAMPLTVTTTPPGADVWATGFTPDDDHWVKLARTPFTVRRLPLGLYRFRVQKPGFESIEASAEVRGGSTTAFVLDAAGSLPLGMVRVPAGIASPPILDDAVVGSFFVDRFEVSNRQFKVFLDAGGYQVREYWQAPFTRDGRVVPWDEAMREFRDSTGHPGPAGWVDGRYPPGQDDYPVSGVSWFEAGAFAAFAGKRLPSIYHWQRAANPGWFSEVLEVSNFSGRGPARVGSYHGIGPYGTFDMAGNVKEWCSNATAGDRFVRGGAWSQPGWTFATLDARSPWDRSTENGFRCIRDVAPTPALDAAISLASADRQDFTPAPDDVFEVYRSLYAYDSGPLDSRSHGIEARTGEWTRETVSFASAVSNERVTAYLYVPRDATPPYQAVIYANSGMALRLPSPQPGEERIFEFIVKNGRALLLPALKGYYQRRYPAPAAGPNDERDRLLAESKDFRRCLDFLESRRDVDRNRLAVFGVSRGGSLVPILAVGDTRLKAAVLFSVGLTSRPIRVPETDPAHFLPRFTVPTLMAAGREDFWFPAEMAQAPMLALLGARGSDKRAIQWAGGHGDLALHYPTLTRDALAWFDRYLGPVR